MSLIRDIRLLFIVFLLLAAGLPLSTTAADKAPVSVTLTDVEQQWLKEHPVIRLAPDPDFKPIEYFDKSGVYQGAAADIIRILEKKLGITITIVHLQNWDEAMDRFKKHEVDLLGAMVRTPDREKFALFTDTLVAVPGGIFTRSGLPTTNLTLKDLKGKRVAVVSNYTAHDIIRNRYPDITLDVVPDIATGLAKASLGMVDYYVENMANATFYSQEAGITNLQMAGKTEFEYRWGIGIRKDWPELQAILNKGLAAISDEERKQAVQQWIYIEGQHWRPTKTFIIGTIATFLGSLLLLAIYGNYSLRKLVRRRTLSLQQELEERQRTEVALKTLTDQLEERILERTAALEREIAERTKSEQAAIASEEKFRELFQNIADPVYISDMNGRIIAANDQASLELCYSREELLEKYIQDLDAIFDAPEKVTEHFRNLPNDRSVTFETIHRRKDGSLFPVEINSYLVRFDGETSVMGVARNITERKRMQEALRESEERLRGIIFSIADWVWEVDENGVYTYSSQKGFDFFGESHGDIIGKTPFDFMPLDEAKRVATIFSEIAAKKAPIKDLENWNIGKNGERICLLTNGVPLLDIEGNLKGYRGVDKDITDYKRAEEEKRNLEERLQRSEKMEALGQLAGGVAHDLNNVLGVLTGYSELLLGEIPEGQRSRGYAEKILQSTEKGAAIIQDLLTLARRGVKVSDVVNLNNVVSDFLKTSVFEKMKDYHPYVTFRTEYDRNLLNTKGSPVHLEKTLMNLVSNAAESISGKGEVTIRTENLYLDKAIRGYDEVKEGDYIVLTVSDTGMGIPEENKRKIFEPFYTKKKMGRSGTGLGLAIVWGTVKDHNGYIDLQTEVGEGTTFTLYFPVTQEELIAQQQKMPIERYMGKGESVLVVDDIAEQRDIAARLLTRLGYSVRVVSSGEEAVEYLKGNKADILVLDMIMAPGIDGLETYQRVLEINPNQKAIIVSGFSETERVKKAQKLGAGDYVKKPYVMEKIGIAIRDELARK